MTVTEISKKIDLNRNSVAKYLEVLLISGHVEMRTYGPAKVFFLSQRVPMSALIDFSSDYILILDRDLKIIQANENFQKLANLEENIIGKKLENVSLSTCDTPEIRLNLKEALSGKRVRKEIGCTIGKKQRYFNLKIIPTTFEDGLPGVTMILEDITDRKMMEDELMRFSNAVKMSTDSIVITDMDTTILDVNDATLEMYGAQNKNELIGKKAFELLAPEAQKDALDALKEAMEKKSKKIRKFKVLTQDGTKFLEVSLGLMKDADGKPMGLVAISRDVTEYEKAK